MRQRRVTAPALLLAVALAAGAYALRSHFVFAPRPVLGAGAARTGAGVSDAGEPRIVGRAERTYVAALREADEHINWQRNRAATTRSYSEYGTLASEYLGHAQLTGDYDDYARAQQAITDGNAAAGGVIGLYVQQAHLDLALHRLSRAEVDLEPVRHEGILGETETFALVQIPADIAYQSGRYDDARDGYERVLAMRRTSSAIYALAQLRWKTGDFDLARTELESARAMYHGESGQYRAWMCTQLGLLEIDRGRFEQAIHDLHDADAELSGWWFVEEHLAQAELLRGNVAAAQEAFARLAESPGHPEDMDALAAILRDSADPFLAESWIARARAAHEGRMRQFPEAAAGHAIDHWLELEDDPDRAVELATQNRDARPGGEAQTKLAQAYLEAGRIDDARATVEVVLATQWSTGELHATAALVYELAGDATAAAAQQEKALARDPHAIERLAWLRTRLPRRPGAATTGTGTR